MKKILSLLTIPIMVTACLVVASAQPKKRKSTIRGASTTGASVRRSKAEPGQTVTVGNRRPGRYVTRNGKRIWVPQGSPAVGNRRGVFEKDQIPVANKPTTNRGVVEREQLEAVKKNKPTPNTNRP